MALTWYIEVDWDNDNAIDADESDRCVGLKIERGRDTYLEGGGKHFSGMNVGTCTWTLDNYDRRYDPFYASSPIYPNVAPGRRARVRVTDGSTTWTLFHGKIDDVVPMGAMVRIVIKDSIQLLKDTDVSHAVDAATTTGASIDAILTAAGYPFSRDLSDGDDIDYWWAEAERAYDAIHDLEESDLGMFWIAGDGTATYRGRHDLLTQANDFTLTDASLLKDIATPQPWVNLRNIVTIKFHRPIVRNNNVLWTLDGTPELSAGASANVIANLTYADRRVAGGTILAPVMGTDYAFNSLEDGSGDNMNAALTVTTVNHGESVLFTLTNAAGRNGFVTLLQVRGAAVDKPTTLEVSADNSAGSGYGERALNLELEWLQDPNTAQDLADWLADWLQEPRMSPKMQLRGQVTTQFAHDLSEIMAFTSTYLGLSSARFRIVGIQHEWLTPNGQDVLTTWRCDPAIPTSGSGAIAFWLLGVTGASELGTTTTLGF